MCDGIEGLEPVQRLSRDLVIAARTLTPDEARFLVDTYYQMQGNRIRSHNQVVALSKGGEPHEVLKWFEDQDGTLERQIARALDQFSGASRLGEWARGNVGIGPVLAAGLLAHIDLEKAPTVGHIWRFAGLDPTVSWEKGQKRPWNADLKTLCWKIGESFVKVSGNPEAFYGKVYAERKVLEQRRNAEGLFAEQAAAALVKKRYGKETLALKAYSDGRLPDAHVHARAKRYAVKLFLAHYHARGFEFAGKVPPLPYPIAHLGHVHVIAAP